MKHFQPHINYLVNQLISQKHSYLFRYLQRHPFDELLLHSLQIELDIGCT